MPDPELTREAKEAIRGYILKLVIPSGTLLAVGSFAVGFLVNDVARTDAYRAAFTEANKTVLDTVSRVSKAESEAARASVVLKEAVVIAETIKASQSLSRSDEQIAKTAGELAQNARFLEAVRGSWPTGNYAVLRGKDAGCPSGFQQVDAHLRAIRQFYPPANGDFAPYIKQAQFGSSNVQCHGQCGQYGENYGELNLSLCVK